jgi:hypothetical protein
MHQFIDSLINGPARYTEQQHMSPGMTLVVVLGVLLLELIAVYVIALFLFKATQNTQSFIGFILRRCGVGEKPTPYTFLELTFPADTSKSAFATEQLHILLRSLVKYRGFWDKLAAHKKPYSLELVATKDDGIRYVLRLPTWADNTIQRTLISFLPGLKVRTIKDYMSTLTNTQIGVLELKLTSDFVLPLQDHKALIEHDPIAYLTAHMTKLAPDETVAFQIVTVPVLPNTHARVKRHIRKLENRIALGKEVSSQLATQRTALGYGLRLLWYPPLWIITACLKVITGIGGILTSMFSKDHDLPEFLKTNRDKKQSDNPYEQEIGQTIKTKLDQHLFEVSLRVLVASKSAEVVQGRLEALIDSFRPFSSSYQAIAVRKSVPVLSPDTKLLPRFKARTLSPHLIDQQTILSSSELSDLYHFPETDQTKTEGFVKSRSRELPAPLSIKRSDAKLDVNIGVNEHGGEAQPIGMTLEQRQKHTYIIGKTGTGKTTLLTSSIYQDMVNGKGLAVLDPHGDMFQELLSIIPEQRQKDVVVFDPADRDYPLGLNLLDPGIEFANEDDKHEWITSSVLSVFAKLADEHQWGPRMEHILRSTTMTALQVPDPSLYTLQRLLTDKKYQKEVAKTLNDPVLKQFWDKEFKLLGTMQLSSATAPLTHRLGHFLTTKMSRHILLQEKSTLRIADIMDEGKILLVNLSKGDIGEDQSFFFGTILTSFIWMAAYQRTKIPEKQRRDFFVYIDEFQNFATRQFADITSEGRKFHVSLIVSHQNIAQIEDQSILKTMVGNASTLICLKASPEDEVFILPYMKPEVETGDIVNLAPYHFYMKTSCDVSEDAFSGLTVPVEVHGSSEAKDLVIAHSREQCGMPKATVEAYMERLFGTEEKKTPKKPKTTNQAVKKPKVIKSGDSSKSYGI